jgi:hypothetical protein
MNPLEFDTQDQDFTSNRLNPKDLVNHLLMMWAIAYIPHSPTQYNNGADPSKPADVIIVDVVDLDGVDPVTGQPGLVARKSWWRQARLIQDLKPRVGNPKPRIARLSRAGGGTGGSVPYELINMAADPLAVARANNWWNSVGGFVPSVPSTTQENAQPFDPPRADAPQWPDNRASAQRPAPSALENQARSTLPGNQNATLDRLRQMSQHPFPGSPQTEEPPF